MHIILKLQIFNVYIKINNTKTLPMQIVYHCFGIPKLKLKDILAGCG